MKKSIAFVFVLALALCGMAGAFAQSEKDFTVRTKDGTVTITGYKGKAAKVFIPATIGGLPVVGIGGFAFENLKNITSVNIPASVTYIGWNAFDGCTGLTSVNIPASVTRIWEGAFLGCTGLTAIQADANNQAYSSRGGVLFSKTGGTLIAYPAGLKGQYSIPVGVTGIVEEAFYGCTGLTSVSIPASVTSIGKYAFWGCTGLTSISISASVTSIGYYAFSGCTGLTSVSIPASVTYIGDETFARCTSLTSVSIPIGVTIIGIGAFADCTRLTSVSIPASVTSIDSTAFYNCTGLTSILVDTNNKKYTSRDGVQALPALVGMPFQAAPDLPQYASARM
ncbi:MAG: hypothetical protein Ta2G_21230 [Termitinemataceae bacterium]|nr:MAG: hypothetical protein Ta2G_21230 [Termitinemataceae bacterium]